MRHVAGEFLDEGLERPLHEAFKVKPDLPRRPQDARVARSMGYLLRRAASKEKNQPKRDK